MLQTELCLEYRSRVSEYPKQRYRVARVVTSLRLVLPTSFRSNSKVRHMTSPKFDAAVTRDTILKLLTDEENAKVSTLEDNSEIAGEYIDLDNLARGVQSGSAGSTHNVLPKSAVNAETLSKIVAMLGRP